MDKPAIMLAVALLVSITFPAGAEPVLLATLENAYRAAGDERIESWTMGGVFTYSVLDGSDFHRARMFEDQGVSVRANTGPLTVTQSVSESTDPDFALLARFLTDGSPGSIDGFQEIEALGLRGNENLLNVLVPRFSPYDLYGYALDRIDRTLTLEMRTPGLDPNGDGRWTDFHVSGQYRLYGHLIPEPSSAALLLCALAALAQSGSCKPQARRRSVIELYVIRGGGHPLKIR